AEDLEALHQRQARVDHGRELAREDHQVLGLDPLLQEREVLPDVLRLLLDRDRVEHLGAQLGDHGGVGGRLDLPPPHRALPGPRVPEVHRHPRSPPPPPARRTLPQLPPAAIRGAPLRAGAPPWFIRLRSSSASALRLIAVSSEISRRWYRLASDWFIV